MEERNEQQDQESLKVEEEVEEEEVEEETKNPYAMPNPPDEKAAIRIGGKVRVKWLNKWYEGKVIDITPQKKDLYKVIQSDTGLPIVLHINQMKPIDSGRPTHEKFVLGAEIAYYDGCLAQWLTGTIDSADIAAPIVIEWKRDNDSNGENMNWFMECDVAPITQNEVFQDQEAELGEEDQDRDTPPPLPPPLSVPMAMELNESSSVENILEGKEVHRSNQIFESMIEEERVDSFDNMLPDLAKLVEDKRMKQQHPNKRRTSVSMKQYYAKSFEKPPANKKSKDKMDKAQLEDYLNNQYALLHGKLDHSLLPAVYTYLHSKERSGIPHHPQSKFFLLHHSQLSRAQSTVFAGHLPRSTTMSSRAESEPGQMNFKNLFRRGGRQKLRKQRTDMSLRPLPPEPHPGPGTNTNTPYEVPVKSRTNLVSKKSRSHGNSGSDIYDEVKLSGSAIAMNKSGIKITATSPKKQMVSAGGSVMLFCEVECKTPVTYEWFKDGTKLSHNDEQVAFPEPGKIQLYALTLSNAGRYQCKITNAAKQASKTFECLLRVEEDTIRRTFSKEVGLHKVGLSSQTDIMSGMSPDKQEQSDAQSTALLPNMTAIDSISFSGARSVSSFLKSPSSMDLTKELLDKDVQRLEEEGKQIMEQEKAKKKKAKDKAKSGKKSKKKRDNRQTNKNNRRRASNVINKEMDSYLDGYGEDYGDSAKVLDPPKKNKSGKKDKKSKKPPKESKKKKSKVDIAIVVTTASDNDNDDDEIKQNLVELLQEDNDPTSIRVEIGVEDDNGVEDVDWEQFEPRKESSGFQSGTAATHENMSESNASIDACPEYDSLTSVSSEFGLRKPEDTGSKKGSSNVDLPGLAVEHYTEGVKRLQKSTEEYQEEHFGKAETRNNSNSLLSKMLKKTKSSS